MLCWELKFHLNSHLILWRRPGCHPCFRDGSLGAERGQVLHLGSHGWGQVGIQAQSPPSLTIVLYCCSVLGTTEIVLLACIQVLPDTNALLTIWLGYFSGIVGGYSVHCSMFSSIPLLYLLDASNTRFCSYDNQSTAIAKCPRGVHCPLLETSDSDRVHVLCRSVV